MLKVENLYDVLKLVRTWPEPSMSGGPSLPKRHRHVPRATVSNPTAQELKATAPDPIVQEYEGDTLEQVPPPLHVPHPIEADIPTEMAPICINMSDTQWVYCCRAEGPLTSHATICTHVGMNLSCSLCPITFSNSDALKWHGKCTHHTLFSCPNLKLYSEKRKIMLFISLISYW